MTSNMTDNPTIITSPAISPEDRMPAATNYFIGRRDQWHTAIPNYSRIRYRNVYPGIDAVYYGNENRLEYDFVVAPGADPRAIRLQFSGADRIAITAQGDLSVEAGGQPIVQKKPVARRVEMETVSTK